MAQVVRGVTGVAGIAAPIVNDPHPVLPELYSTPCIARSSAHIEYPDTGNRNVSNPYLAGVSQEAKLNFRADAFIPGNSERYQPKEREDPLFLANIKPADMHPHPSSDLVSHHEKLGCAIWQILRFTFLPGIGFLRVLLHVSIVGGVAHLNVSSGTRASMFGIGMNALAASPDANDDILEITHHIPVKHKCRGPQAALADLLAPHQSSQLQAGLWT
ncbi:hypothetical protein BDQ12DRAFT_723156 [Crucibulum laeve]|uniref:Uncharacterized protein n=1 Tax=Crucibulum laeve TaxID=68775 RepID=A0A5C3M382_9AGAR|nr:hypothetical protein BDQ12DRAFT_723156 [Crucibulum laeve]